MPDKLHMPDPDKLVSRARQEPAEDFEAFVDELRWAKPLREDVRPTKAASVILCLLERHLTGTRRDTLVDHLPSKLANLLEGCQITEGAPIQHKDEQDFLGDVGDALGVEPSTALQITTAVFTALRDRLSEEEAQWVANQLPPNLADLWRRPV